MSMLIVCHGQQNIVVLRSKVVKERQKMKDEVEQVGNRVKSISPPPCESATTGATVIVVFLVKKYG
jgi:uncharacterized protein YaaQ